ncbi:MAG: hypothetical protein RQ748_00785 [Elusimicrobiales bacterium]|nr:hypothetical protein [Elusimicrobiales bacterium]
MRLQKVISKLKIAVTSDCCLSCSHCFIDKSAGLTVKESDARAAVDTLLSSPGAAKKLELYGGEALLKLPLLERIADYARSEAARRGKTLSIWLASNGILLGPAELEFIRSRDIVLSISLYGSAASHDAVRRFPGGGGSFAALKRLLPAVFSVLDPLKVTALLCVHPERAGLTDRDLAGILALGFRVLNIECVHGSPWGPERLAAFSRSLERCRQIFMRTARGGGFFAFESFIERASPARFPGPEYCPFLRDLELFPDGYYSLYPFGFVDYPRRAEQVRVGTPAAGFSGRFRDCRPGGRECPHCVSRYYRVPGLSGGSEAYALRTAFLDSLLSEVLRSEEAPLKRYARELVSLSASGW